MVSPTPCPPHVALMRGRQQGYRKGYEKGFEQATKVFKNVSSEDKPKSSNLLHNLFIIIDTNLNNIDNSEEYVIKKFTDKGYECEDCRMVGGGHPDFIFRKGIEVIYVEAKSCSYGLSVSQARWIMQNPDKNVILYYVDNSYNGGGIKECGTQVDILSVFQ